jgi:hypothetical protein
LVDSVAHQPIADEIVIPLDDPADPDATGPKESNAFAKESNHKTSGKLITRSVASDYGGDSKVL